MSLITLLFTLCYNKRFESTNKILPCSFRDIKVQKNKLFFCHRPSCSLTPFLTLFLYLYPATQAIRQHLDQAFRWGQPGRGPAGSPLSSLPFRATETGSYWCRQIPVKLRSQHTDLPPRLQHLLSEVDNNKVSSDARSCKHWVVWFNEDSLQEASPGVAKVKWSPRGRGRR